MKLKKSQLKEAIKSIARECLNERLVKKQEKNGVDEASYKVVAPHAYTDVNRKKARTIQTEPTVNEDGDYDNKNVRPTLPPDDGAYKVVDKHAYTNAKKNRSLTVQTDPHINEDDKWIQGAVKHPGRCAHMGSSECPEGSPQYNLAKRFKRGDIHQDNLKNEAGLTSEEDSIDGDGSSGGLDVSAGGADQPYDEREEIKLIKIMKLVADRLQNMHKDIQGDEEPLQLSNGTEEPLDDPTSGETDLSDITSDEEEPSKPVNGEEDAEKTPDPFSSADNDEEDDEPKLEKIPKKKTGKKEEDPTEFTKKLAKEYKVQKRSYRTSNDISNDPKNLVDPEVPST